LHLPRPRLRVARHGSLSLAGRQLTRTFPTRACGPVAPRRRIAEDCERPRPGTRPAMMRPRIRRPDGILGLALDGYDFGRRRLDARETDVWRTRLGPVPVIWMRGAAAAELFYDADRFERSGVLPRRVRRTLTGEGAVQELDGDAHRDRKSMLMRVMTPDSI